MNKFLLATALIGLIIVPISGAYSEGELVVGALEVQGQSSIDGLLELFHSKGAMPMALSGTANSVKVEQFERGSYDFLASNPDPTYCVGASRAGDCHHVQTTYHEGVDLLATNKDAGFIVQAYPYAGTAKITNEISNVLVSPHTSAFLDGGNGGDVSPDGGAGASEPGPGTAQFVGREVIGDVLIATTPQVATIQLSGNFVLELMGVGLAVVGEQGTSQYDSGEHIEPGVVAKRTVHFTRLYIEDGAITLNQKGGSMSWAQRAMDIQSDQAQVTLHDATGLLYVDGVEKRLSGDTEVIRGPMDMSLDAQSGAAQAALRGSQFQPTPATATVGDLVEGTWAYAIGVLGLMAAVTVGLLARRKPALKSIEALLEGGDYSKAAKLATRAIRREPLKESAHLARAIAWSRDGKQENVVTNLGRFIRANNPSDGTLHYVLGLAHRELGEESKARAAMEEAVRRTPALLAQVDSGTGYDAHAYT